MSATIQSIGDIIDEGGNAVSAAADTVIAEDAVPGEVLPAGLTVDGEGYLFALKRPITMQFRAADGTVRAEKIEHLRLRRLTGRDLREMMTSNRKDGSMLLLETAVDLPATRKISRRWASFTTGRAPNLKR
jgi:hypothetical protein